MEKKNITLINLKPPYNLEPNVLKLASPQRTASIIQVLIYENEVNVVDLETENSEKRPIKESTFEDIFSSSHTIIVPDAMFTKESKVFFTDAFVDTALGPLERFYKEYQGNVIIMCFEGIFGIGNSINPIFGTNWTVKFFESCVAEPTKNGLNYLGPNIPKSPELTESPYFIDAPEKEGLYSRMLTTKENFIKDFHAEDETFERLGITPEKGMDCFDAEKSWEKYVRRYSSRYVICIHEGESATEGTVVWNGDRGQSVGMSFVFCKFLNLGASATNLLDEKQYSEEYLIGSKGGYLPSGMTIASVLVILLAIVARLMGFAYE